MLKKQFFENFQPAVYSIFYILPSLPIVLAYQETAHAGIISPCFPDVFL